MKLSLRRRTRRLIRASITLAVGCLALTASVAPPAFGHAAFLESKPPPGARLEQSPSRITLDFTEPLNRRLTTVKLLDAGSGKRVAAVQERGAKRAFVLRPSARLDTGAYRVDWHTVSTEDGHALEGSFSFGVRAPAAGGEQQVEQGPLARDGWLRILLRAVFYGCLFFFAGGLLTAALLSGRRRATSWLMPEGCRRALERAGRDPDVLTRRAWRRTIEAGWLAAAGAAAVALAEAADAAGGLSLDGLSSFLLSNVSGLARVAAVLAIVMAAIQAPRMRFAAAFWSALAFLAIAIGGHANSAEPRAAAVASDWIHLLAGAVWIGGIAQIVVTWAPSLRAAGRELRLAVMREVLPRFGRVALPAFLVVVASGLTNALIQLGEPPALWETAYGRVLALKVAVVGLIAIASYRHALRLRPRLLAVNPHPPDRLERRHWRLLRSEPVLAVLVVAAAATLVAFPLPPRQLGTADEAEEAKAAAPPCNPCPLREPTAGELAVAEQAGSSIAAAWVKRGGGGLTGTVRVMGSNREPVRSAVEIPGAEQKECGPGCHRFRLRRAPRFLAARVEEKGKLYTARLPVSWRRIPQRRAQRLLERVQRSMQSLRALREHETVTSGPGSLAVTGYQLQSPHRMAYLTNNRAATIIIGRRQWFKTGDVPWQRQRYGGGGPPFRTRSWFRWTSYARAVRLLKGPRRARTFKLALFDPGTPVWFRLTVERRSLRVLRARMVAGGHFMHQRFFAFNRALTIRPPRLAGNGR